VKLVSNSIQELEGRARASILVVDDDRNVLDLLASDLVKDGFEVESASNGAQAIDALKRRKFDLAITDLRMPGMDGIATLEALRSIDPDLEVIVATGYASVDTAVECMKRGAYDYVQKPYNMRELRLLIDRAVTKSRTEGMLALYEASNALLSTLELRDLIPNVLSICHYVLRSDRAALVLSSDERNDLYGAPEGARISDELLLAIAHAAWEKDEALSLPHKPEWRDRLSREGCAHVLAYPLLARDRRTGVLVVVRDEGSPGFSPSELRRGTVLANQLTLSIENARLYGELQDGMRELVRAQNDLVQAERLAMAGHIAGSVAHEVNNALAVIGANADALRDYQPLLEALWRNGNEAAIHLDSQPSAISRVLAQRLRDGAGDRGHTMRLIGDLANIIDETQVGVARISDLVAGFIRLSRPSEASPPVRIAIGDLISDCVRTLPERARKRVQIGSLPRGTASIAFMSREDLRAAISTLLEFVGAPEHARAEELESRIEVQVELRERRPCIVIREPSIVLSVEERRRFFDPQLRVETTNGRTMRLDVGLALTYAALARNRADVSVGDGPGLTICLLLPSGPIGVV
jgi:DNA-binding response OmpR family regulator